MNRQNIFQKLRASVDPYLFYWEEWSNDHNCNLTEEEIETIGHYLKNDFQSETEDEIEKQEEIEILSALIRKLELGQQVFNLFVVTDFLHSLLQLAKKNPGGVYEFINTPIPDLKLSTDLKEALLKFKVHTISMMLAFYKPHEFRSGLLYKCVTEFQRAKKKERMLASKPTPREKITFTQTFDNN